MLQSSSPSSDVDSGTGATLRAVEGTPGIPHRKQRGRLFRSTQHWTRWLHVYTSMIALLVVLFFGVTGLTLNHPDWTFGFDPVSESYTGTLPEGWVSDDGTVEFLVISEYLRATYDVRGDVSDFGSDTTQGWVSYAGPGYSADAFFDVDDGTYTLSVEQQGWIGVMNDLHKGRDTTSSWNWLIDVSAMFLVAISLTGLGIQLMMKKRRRMALMWAMAGMIVTVIMIAIAMG